MKKMTRKQAAAIQAYDAAKVLEVVEVNKFSKEVYQVHAEGKKVFVAQVSTNFGNGAALCVYLTEPDPVKAWEGSGLILGGFATSQDDAMDKIRRLWTN